MPRVTARTRLSTTLDASLLEAARNLHSGTTDAALMDDALRALLARNRAHEIDLGYAASERLRQVCAALAVAVDCSL